LVLTFAYVTKSSQLQQDQVQNEVADVRFELLENTIAGLDYDIQECVKKLHCLVVRDKNFTSIDMRTPMIELSYLMNNVTERKSKYPTLGSLVDAVQDGQCHNFDCPVNENLFKEDQANVSGASTISRVKRQECGNSCTNCYAGVCTAGTMACFVAAFFTMGLSNIPCVAVIGTTCYATGMVESACIDA